MIHVAREIDCGRADVEIDPRIPLKVSRWPRRQSATAISASVGSRNSVSDMHVVIGAVTDGSAIGVWARMVDTAVGHMAVLMISILADRG